MPRSPQN
ncbi:hypothetical protein F383_17001 [Gossypium arboreum]|nr:hypothetical protein F383_35255 [Gossypium arboreum]KHG13071.1 hypothetical protein F383_17001 [Gossypium arboreum]